MEWHKVPIVNSKSVECGAIRIRDWWWSLVLLRDKIFLLSARGAVQRLDSWAVINGDQDIERSVANHTIANSDCVGCEKRKNLRGCNAINQTRILLFQSSEDTYRRNISPESDLFASSTSAYYARCGREEWAATTKVTIVHSNSITADHKSRHRSLECESISVWLYQR